MSSWVWFAARRSARSGASAPRAFGPDGRALRRPWRLVAPAVAAQVTRQRAQRRQPRWPRLLGVLLLGVAVGAAVHPVGAVPTHVAASVSTGPGARLLQLAAVAPAGALPSPPTVFRWRDAGGHSPTALVLCDADYVPLARFDGIDGDALAVSGRLADLLGARGTFHWYVETAVGAATVRSGFESFTIR
jgi:hypothetical protein